MLGGEPGKFIQKRLEQEDIPADFYWTTKSTRTNVSRWRAGSRAIQRVIAQGPLVDGKTLAEFETKLKGLMRGCSLVALCGRNAHGAPTDYYARLITMIKKAKLMAALDTSGAALAQALVARPEIIKPNVEEAQAVLGRSLSSMKRSKEAVKEFHRRGVAAVLLTMAGNGALGGFRGRIWFCRAPKIGGGHTIGCGDAFLAGFLFARCRGYNFPDALRFAVCCGSINCRSPLPGKIGRAEATLLYKNTPAVEV
jgi:tagatose 6-phosphate kinase